MSNFFFSGENPSLPVFVNTEDFKEAIEQFIPSLTDEDIDYYENFKTSENSY